MNKYIIHYNIQSIIMYFTGIGMVLTILTGLVAMGLEILRKQEITSTGGMFQELADGNFTASHISVMWQVPQYALMGAGEVFASITGNDLSKQSRSVVTVFSLCPFRFNVHHCDKAKIIPEIKLTLDNRLVSFMYTGMLLWSFIAFSLSRCKSQNTCTVGTR